MLDGMIVAPITYVEYEEEKPIIEKVTPFYQIVSLGDIKMIDMSFRGLQTTRFRDHFLHYMQQIIGTKATEMGHKYDLSLVARHFKQITENGISPADYGDEVSDLWAMVGDRAEQQDALINERISSGMVESYDLPFVFKVGDSVTAYFRGVKIAGEIHSTGLVRTAFASYAVYRLTVYHNLRGQLRTGVVEIKGPLWDGLAPISSLPVQRITDQDISELLDRGKAVYANVKSGSYVSYVGVINQPSYWSSSDYKADGRVIIDPISGHRLEPELFRNICGALLNDDETEELVETLDEADLYRLLPFTMGFSFSAKKWGLLNMLNMFEVEWAENAWDKLVMEQKRKDVVRALVSSHDDSFSDIIDGKGGGCIFLLHGPPGQGKTLTAEAVAEVLHRPLYSISVGELGVNPEQLESSLRRALDVAEIWNAVLLLDEADIFLEARDEKDIVRNAMVGVFLRLLEYHNGVMFLTTNRVKNIDGAFYSRITLALKFENADYAKRRSIWVNLLASALVTTLSSNIDALASHDMNGRQIKNNIRTAKTLAKARGEEVSFSLLEEVIELTGEFQREMTTA
jgi:hypothetical protein